LLSIGVYFVLT